MSNTRKLKPPPSGFVFERFRQVVLESDLTDEEKQDILVRASRADRKGRIRDVQPPLDPLPDH